MSAPPEIVGRSYTRGRRYPKVIGTITTGMGGQRWQLPGGPYSIPQFFTTGVGIFVMVQTQPLWGSGSLLDPVLIVLLPALLGWGMRRARIEGRDPHRAAVGLLKLLIAAPGGQRTMSAARPQVITHRIRVSGVSSAAEDHPLEPPAAPAADSVPPPQPVPAALVQSPRPVADAPHSALARLLASRN